MSRHKDNPNVEVTFFGMKSVIDVLKLIRKNKGKHKANIGKKYEVKDEQN